MKMNNTHLKIALGLALMTGFAQAGQDSAWTGTTGNWTDATWTNVAPGVYPGDASNTPSDAHILNGGTVTLDTAIDLGNGGWNSELRLTSGSTLNIQANLTGVGVIQTGSFSSVTINQTAGAVSASGANMFIAGSGGNTDGQTYQSAWNISAGSLSVTNTPGNYGLGYASGIGNRGYLNITGTGSVNTGAGTLNINQADLSVSGSGSYAHSGTLNVRGGGTGATATSGAISLAGGTFDVGTLTMTSTADTNSQFEIVGSSHTTLTVDTFDAFNSTTAGSATLRFIADTSGVSFLDVGTLNLNSGTDNSTLNLDLTNWDGTTGLVDGTHLILADYGILDGTFSSFNITNGSGSLDYAYDLDGSGDLAIAYVIPEPGTLALFAIAGLGMVIGLRRRTNSGR